MIAHVHIAGTSWDTMRVLADISIRHGRSAWGDAPNASSASVTLWDAPKDLPAIVGVGNTIWLETQAGDPRFTGTVTDAAVTFPDPALGARVTLTAIGKLADLGRVTLGQSGYPAEPASSRAARIFAEAGITQAARFECPPANDYEMAARPAQPTTALALLTELADTLGAALFDTPTGEVVVQALHARPFMAPHEIPAAHIAYAPQWRQAWEVENAVTVQYAGGQVTEEDAASIARWGKREGTVVTQLADTVDATERALDRLVRLATPRWQLGDLLTDLPPEQLPLEPGKLALVGTDQVTGLPLPGYPMVIEGWTDTQRGGTWTTTLHLSDGLMSFAGLAWDDIPPADPAYTWATIDQATTWTQILTLPDLKA